MPEFRGGADRLRPASSSAMQSPCPYSTVLSAILSNVTLSGPARLGCGEAGYFGDVRANFFQPLRILLRDIVIGKRTKGWLGWHRLDNDEARAC